MTYFLLKYRAYLNKKSIVYVFVYLLYTYYMYMMYVLVIKTSRVLSSRARVLLESSQAGLKLNRARVRVGLKLYRAFFNDLNH